MALVLAIALFCGCERTPGLPPPTPPAPIPPASSPKQSFPNDPLLQRLADAGAGVDPAAFTTDHTPFTMVVFREKHVSRETFSDLARVPGNVSLILEECDLPAGALTALDGMSGLLSLSFKRCVDDETLSELQSLPNLGSLRVEGADVTFRGLAFLQTTRLVSLELRGTAVGDDAMPTIGHFASLKELDLAGTRITDGGMEALRGLRALVRLDLGGCQIGDAGLAHVASLTQLGALTLDHSNVTDAGLVELAPLSSLTFLQLDGTRISDAGLRHLQPLCSLTDLRITDTLVTDAGLAHLATLPKLGSLVAYRTRVTKGSRKLLPKCDIRFDGSHDPRNYLIP